MYSTRHLGGFPYVMAEVRLAIKPPLGEIHRHCTSDSTMIGIGLFVLTIIHVVLSDQIPPHCRGPPPGVENPRECCKAEKIFNEEDLKACGIEKPDKKDKPPRIPDCSEQICLLNKYSLMKDENTVDKEAIAGFLDEYAERNADFKSAIDTAKEICLQDNLPGPPEVCEANKIFFCIGGNMFMNCPKWEDTDNCNKLKTHFEDCKKYFN